MSTAEATTTLWAVGITADRTDLLYLLSSVAQSAAAIIALVVTMRLIVAQVGKRYEVPVRFVGSFGWQTWLFYVTYGTALLSSVVLMLLGALNLAALPVIPLTLGVLLLPFYMRDSLRKSSLQYFFTTLARHPRLRRQYLGDLFHTAKRAMSFGDLEVFRRASLLLFSVQNEQEDGRWNKRDAIDAVEGSLADDHTVSSYWQMTMDDAAARQSFAPELFKVLRDCASPISLPRESALVRDRFFWLNSLFTRLRGLARLGIVRRNPYYSPMLVRRIAEDFGDIIASQTAVETEKNRQREALLSAGDKGNSAFGIQSWWKWQHFRPRWYLFAIETMCAIWLDEEFADQLDLPSFREYGRSDIADAIKGCDQEVLEHIAAGQSEYLEWHRPAGYLYGEVEGAVWARDIKRRSLLRLKYMLWGRIWKEMAEASRSKAISSGYVYIPDNRNLDIWRVAVTVEEVDASIEADFGEGHMSTATPA